MMAAGRGAASPRMRSANGIVYSELVKDISELRDNDEAAAAEQLAQVCHDVMQHVSISACRCCATNQRLASTIYSALRMVSMLAAAPS